MDNILYSKKFEEHIAAVKEFADLKLTDQEIRNMYRGKIMLELYESKKKGKVIKDEHGR